MRPPWSPRLEPSVTCSPHQPSYVFIGLIIVPRSSVLIPLSTLQAPGVYLCILVLVFYLVSGLRTYHIMSNENKFPLKNLEKEICVMSRSERMYARRETRVTDVCVRARTDALTFGYRMSYRAAFGA